MKKVSTGLPYTMIRSKWKNFSNTRNYLDTKSKLRRPPSQPTSSGRTACSPHGSDSTRSASFSWSSFACFTSRSRSSLRSRRNLWPWRADTHHTDATSTRNSIMVDGMRGWSTPCTSTSPTRNSLSTPIRCSSPGQCSASAKTKAPTARSLQGFTHYRKKESQ